MKPRQHALRRLRERDTDGVDPIAKLIKAHGVGLRDLGDDIQSMSYAELREALRRHGVEP